MDKMEKGGEEEGDRHAGPAKSSSDANENPPEYWNSQIMKMETEMKSKLGIILDWAWVNLMNKNRAEQKRKKR